MCLIIIILITFVVLKVKSPTVPRPLNPVNEESNKAMKILFLGIVGSLIVSVTSGVIVAIVYVKGGISVISFHITQSIVNTILRVVFPAYYIYSFPNLRKYAYKAFEKLLPSSQVAPCNIPE